MRISGFSAFCPHVKDEILHLNGGRFNLDHYLKVLREKAIEDPTLVLQGAGCKPMFYELPEPTSESVWEHDLEAEGLVQRLLNGDILSEQESVRMEQLASLYMA